MTEYVDGSGAVTPIERDNQRSGMIAGRRLTRYALALSIVENVAAQRGSGVTVPESAYLMPPEPVLDPEGVPMTHPVTGLPLVVKPDAREVLKAVEASAKAREKQRRDLGRLIETLPEGGPAQREARKARAALGRNTRGKWSARTDPERMTPADVDHLARYCVGCLRGFARQLTDEDATDAYGDATVAIMALADARGRMPRWDAMGESDARPAPATRLVGLRHKQRLVSAYVTAERGRWQGWAYRHAQTLNKARNLRLDHEHPADWNPAEDGAPLTAEQRSALNADLGSAELLARLAADAPDIDLLGFTVPGSPLTMPERDALSLRALMLSREDRAKARGASTEAVKKSAQRGSAHLETRMIELAADADYYGSTPEDEARRWGRDADRFARDHWTTTPVVEGDSYRADALAPIYGGVPGKLPGAYPRPWRRSVALWADAIGAPCDATTGIRGPVIPDSTARMMTGPLVHNDRDPKHGMRPPEDRIPTIGKEDAAYVIPPCPKGAGTRANVPSSGHDTTRGYAPVPRVTATGTPSLPGHRYSAPSVRCSRVLAGVSIAPESTLDVSNARTIEPRTDHLEGVLSEAYERTLLRRDADKARADADAQYARIVGKRHRPIAAILADRDQRRRAKVGRTYE